MNAYPFPVFPAAKGELHPSAPASFFVNPEGEFRVALLYVPAVLFHLVLLHLFVPTVGVMWDSVFYKTLARGLFHFSTFDLGKHFPVPPLYPLVLSPAFWAPHYWQTEWIQSTLNPVLYFLGLYPLYGLSRLLLAPRAAAAACLVYVCYPSALYAQWTMSENLAIPLTLLAVFLAARELVRPGSAGDAARLGLALAAVVLTRIPSLFLCIAILLWLAGSSRSRTAFRNASLAAGAAVFAVAGVWYGLGYTLTGDHSLFYSPVNRQAAESLGPLLSNWINLSAAHLSVLWLEGGLFLLPLAVVHGFWILRHRREWDPARGKIAMFLLFLASAVVLSVSLFLALRRGYEFWSVSLRYTCYANLVCIPLAIGAIENRRPCVSLQKNLLLFGGTVVILSAGFLLPGVWEGLSLSGRYFANAPSLEFFLRLAGEGPWIGAAFFLLLSLASAVLLFQKRRLGLALLLLALIYIQGTSLGRILERRDTIIHQLGIVNLHEFCAQLECGRWSNLPLYVQYDEYVDYLRPNLLYWLGQESTPLPKDTAPPPPPYLFLTYEEQPSGRLVFLSGRLRAYLYP